MVILNSISIRDLYELNNPIIVDIRASYYYELGHMRGAISIPYYNLLNNYHHYLNKYSSYYLYCDSGDQSREIADRLRNFGYNTTSIEGGYLEYQRLFGKVW